MVTDNYEMPEYKGFFYLLFLSLNRNYRNNYQFLYNKNT